MIPYGKQQISESDIRAVEGVLRSDFLTQGPVVPMFEEALGQKVGASHAILMNSATSALHVSCAALGLGPGDVAWTSPNSFVASANCAKLCGANVDFVDIDPATLCMDVEALKRKLEDCQKFGKTLPKVVIPVHFAGLSCDMPAIYELGQKFGFRIIEDASHAVGTTVQFEEGGPSHHVGSCRYSDICVFSFHPVKIITTGEGGAALTQSEELAHRLRSLRSHGITRSEPEITEPCHGGWYYQMLELAPNYRMTDIQAALGLNQLMRLDEFIEERQQIAGNYKSLIGSDAVFSNWGVETQYVPSYCMSSYHLFVLKLPPERRKHSFDALREAGYGVNVHYIPIHTQPYYQQQGFEWGHFPHSEAYYSGAISLPIFPGLPAEAPVHVVEIISRVLSQSK